jgi:hypothetical protein
MRQEGTPHRLENDSHSWVWWYMPIISTLEKQRQEDHKFKAILGYIS